MVTGCAFLENIYGNELMILDERKNRKMSNVGDKNPKDKLYYVGLPEWAIGLREDYRRAIWVFYMYASIIGLEKINTREEPIVIIRDCLGGRGTNQDIEDLISIYQEHGVIIPDKKEQYE